MMEGGGGRRGGWQEGDDQGGKEKDSEERCEARLHRAILFTESSVCAAMCGNRGSGKRIKAQTFPSSPPFHFQPPKSKNSIAFKLLQNIFAI